MLSSYSALKAEKLTLCLNNPTSSSVNVSAFAITGMRLTFVCSRRINSTSIGLSLCTVSLDVPHAVADSRVTSRLNEVDTSVNTVINQLFPVDSVLLLEIRVETSLNVVNNWFPTVRVSGYE
jgi:hypothetical protein